MQRKLHRALQEQQVSKRGDVAVKYALCMTCDAVQLCVVGNMSGGVPTMLLQTCMLQKR
jgi:hypothetical protein